MNNIDYVVDNLSGRQYRDEIPSGFEKFLKENNLVVVFGASDDLIEFRGVINDEFGVTKIHLDADGIISNKCECEDCPYEEKRRNDAKYYITAKFPGELDIDFWIIETNIPHKTFKIYEDNDLFCIGIVFNMDDIVNST